MGRARFAVRDTGIGIESGDLARIFEPFVQSGRTRGQGLGIGLALVKELALKHRGAVRARSAGAGGGAEFVLTLPLGEQATAAVGKASASRRSSGLSVLIVEDNEDAGTTLADVLEMLDHHVQRVSTGRAGVDAASARMPDVLICDSGPSGHRRQAGHPGDPRVARGAQPVRHRAHRPCSAAGSAGSAGLGIRCPSRQAGVDRRARSAPRGGRAPAKREAGYGLSAGKAQVARLSGSPFRGRER